MEIKSQPESKSITYKINRPEFNHLKEGFKYFYANALRASPVETNRSFYLGYAINDPIFLDIPAENGIQIKQPLQEEHPLLVNLTTLGIIRLNKEKIISTRIADESRLLILLENK